MLSHVNKRVRGHDQIKLPLDALLDLYLSNTSGPLVKNFAVVYVEMAMERSLQDQQLAAVCLTPLTFPLDAATSVGSVNSGLPTLHAIEGSCFASALIYTQSQRGSTLCDCVSLPKHIKNIE